MSTENTQQPTTKTFLVYTEGGHTESNEGLDQENYQVLYCGIEAENPQQAIDKVIDYWNNDILASLINCEDGEKDTYYSFDQQYGGSEYCYAVEIVGPHTRGQYSPHPVD